MRILYRATGFDAFDFIVRPAGAAKRAAYAPDGEIRGAARLVGGDLIIRELTLTRERGLNGLTLRAVALGEIRAQMLADLQRHPDLLDAAEEFSPPSVAPLVRPRAMTGGSSLGDALRELRNRAPKRGRRDDDFYRAVAVAYILMWRESPRDPVAALAEELRAISKLHEDVRTETVAGWVRKARAIGWLTPAQHGRSGADFGERWQQTDKGRSS